jgi:hypothetical protein
MILETVYHELDSGGGVGDKDEIEIIGVGVEKPERSLSDGIDSVTCNGGWCGGGMGVSIKICDQVCGKVLDQGFGVKLWSGQFRGADGCGNRGTNRGSTVIEICFPFQLRVFAISEILNIVGLHVFYA